VQCNAGIEHINVLSSQLLVVKLATIIMCHFAYDIQYKTRARKPSTEMLHLKFCWSYIFVEGQLPPRKHLLQHVLSLSWS